MNKLTSGLFMLKGFHPIYFFKDLIIMFKRIVFLVKHGYAEPALWETYQYFIDIMLEILKSYKENRCGSPIVIDDFVDTEECANRNSEEWDNILNDMISNLKLMCESNSLYENYGLDAQGESMTEAKNKFFELFSKYFYNLWD